MSQNPRLKKGTTMKTILLSAAAALGLLLASTPSQADIQPAELVAGSISFQGNYIVGNIYCGGTYGQTYPGGRTATLEAREGSAPWRVLYSNRLPDIGTKGFYITVPYANPVRVTTTFRLTVHGSDRNNTNNVRTATFRAPIDPRVRARVTPKYNPFEKASKIYRIPKVGLPIPK